LYLGGSLQGIGLADCDTAGTSKLLWDVTTGRFSCGTDTNTTYTAGQGLTLTSTSLKVNAVLTGTLLKFTVMTGSVIRASTTLASSGTLKVLGNMSGATLNINGYASFSGTVSVKNNIITRASFSGSALNIMAGNSYILGNLMLGSSAAADTKLEVIGTISGSTLYANSALRSSGSLVVEGTMTGSRLYVSGSQSGQLFFGQRSNVGVWKWPEVCERFPIAGPYEQIQQGSGATFATTMSGVYTSAFLNASGYGSGASIQVWNKTARVFSTVISTDNKETTSTTAATPYVINAANARYNKFDNMRIDVTGAGTPLSSSGVYLTLCSEKRNP
jgi:hypothetical protein